MRYRTVGVGTTGRAPQPIIARCQTIQAPVEPVAYDWVKLVVVRQGSAILLSEFGEGHIKVGDVLVLGTQTLCGTEPEGAITVTALYLASRAAMPTPRPSPSAVLLPDRASRRSFRRP